jgi:hypothetical protein
MTTLLVFYSCHLDGQLVGVKQNAIAAWLLPKTFRLVFLAAAYPFILVAISAFVTLMLTTSSNRPR